MIPVVADADVLFGATTRGLLIHLDYRGLIRLHWSPLILDELSRALVDTGRKPNQEAARRHEQLMRAVLPHADVPVTLVQKQFQTVAPAMRSAKDMHVAACALATDRRTTCTNSRLNPALGTPLVRSTVSASRRRGKHFASDLIDDFSS